MNVNDEVEENEQDKLDRLNKEYNSLRVAFDCYGMAQSGDAADLFRYQIRSEAMRKQLDFIEEQMRAIIRKQEGL